MTTTDDAPLLAEENDEDHPQQVAATHGDVRVVLIDSARYCDSRNTGDVVVAASYCGVLPVRLIAPHRPRAAIGHDIGIGADGAGIAGLAYLEALGIPAAAVEAESAEIGNAADMYANGRISRANILAERCGVERKMAVADACRLLATADPGDRSATTKVRREEAGRAGGHAVVVTDSIVFARPEDRENVLVTAGHTGKTGARFIEAVSPRGFICADGGAAKAGSGTSGLARLDEVGIPGACYDVMTAAMGDAFDAWERGRISAVNELARRIGVLPGQRVEEAAFLLLAAAARASGDPDPRAGAANLAPGVAAPDRSAARSGGASGAGHSPGVPATGPAAAPPGSEVLARGVLQSVAPEFAEGLARVRDVVDGDGALPAVSKALFVAGAACVRHQDELARRHLRRARMGGLELAHARGAGIALLISRGEDAYRRFAAAVDDEYGEPATPGARRRDGGSVAAPDPREYFAGYFGSVPDYIELMAEHAPRALEGYVLMRRWSLARNLLPPLEVELLLCAVNAAELCERFVAVHAGGARRAGASESQLVEAVLCAIPVSGVASWLPGAGGIIASRD